jgi:outer membrane protein OmpA-like peptidoglycan-associated protein
MSSQSMYKAGRVVLLLPVMFAVLFMFVNIAAAQDQPVPKVELFGGYSFFYPGANVTGQLPGALLPLSSALESNPRGVGVSGTYNFNRWLGLTLDTSTNSSSHETGIAMRIDDTAFSNLSLGPKITFRHDRFSPFFEGLVGAHRLMPDAFHDVSKFGFMFGGGLDINLSRHIALRLIRVDYVYSKYSYGSPSLPSTELHGLRAQTGLVFNFWGGAAQVSASAACSVQPNEVFANESVTATAAGSNFNPKGTVKYNWSGSGLRVAGANTSTQNASTQIDTAGLQPGSYDVNANLSDGSKKGNAFCTARFNVKQPHPPVIACSSDPGTIAFGGTATIRANATSPDNRRLTYSYSASAGSVSGTDTTAALNSRGAQPGGITVTCNVGDDRIPSLTASATTSVNVQPPPPPPPPPAPVPAPQIKELESRLALHSIYFATAQPFASNPKGGLVPSQEQILLTLAADFKEYLKYKPEAHLILGGHADPRGSAEYNKGLTQRRAVRTTDTLVANGVPSDHIDAQSFGKEDQLTADQIKQQIADNPDLSPDDRKKMLDNLQVMVLANNRRIDVSLSTTGQKSTRRYPFNAQDFLALINTRDVEKKAALKK